MSDRERTTDERARDEPTDAELLAASAAGDQRAFGVLVRRYVRSATALAFDLLEDLDEAEDSVQDAFVVVLRRAAAFDATLAFGPWFFGVVRNTARRRRERASRRRGLLQRWWPRDSGGAAPSPQEPTVDVAARVDEAVSRLPEMQRRCFTLNVTHGVPAVEIAAMLGIAESTVRQHVFRARVVLRERLNDLISE